MFVSDVHCPGPPLYVPLAPYLCLPCSCICPSIFTCRCLVPSLQGESAAVAEAVFEAALPRNAGDTLPSSPPGILVAIADRLDSLVRNNVFLPHPPHSPSPAYPVSPLHTHTSPPPTLTHPHRLACLLFASVPLLPLPPPHTPPLSTPPPAQVGLFAAGCGPSAAADPYGLRRAAYGMLQVSARMVVGQGGSL